MSERTNASFDWDSFNIDLYYKQYQDQVLPDDRILSRALIGALLESEIPLRSLKTGIDACNGGLPIGPSLIAPFIADTGKLYWSEYGKPQVSHAAKIIKMGREGNLGKFSAHQTHMAQCHPAWADAGFRACTLGEAVQQSVFDLPADTYDIGITCFGPESLTGDYEEWRLAVETFLRSVHKGGPAAMLYTENSNGYLAGMSYPAVSVDQAQILEAVQPELKQIHAGRIDPSHTARVDGDPHSYTGMGYVIGLKR